MRKLLLFTAAIAAIALGASAAVAQNPLSTLSRSAAR